jgi:organic radical activating enzyme
MLDIKTFENEMLSFGHTNKKSIKAIYENGNHYVCIFDDGTKVKDTKNPDDTYFTYDFAENADIKITNYCDAGCPYCHEGSTTKGKHADLKSMHIVWASLKPGTEMAIGGGNALAHPDLEWFLNVLKEKSVLANLTVNQRHIVLYKDLIHKLIEEKLVNGIGISLVDSDNFPSEVVDSFGDNVVIHTIAGILTEKDLKVLRNRKVLVLGYKTLRRGKDFFSDEVTRNIEWLKSNIGLVRNTVKLLSFDCLGIEQINPRQELNISEDDWNLLFQGSDTDVKDAAGNITCCTFYIDAVEKKVARMSTAALDKRYDILEDDRVETLFEKSTQDW